MIRLRHYAEYDPADIWRDQVDHYFRHLLIVPAVPLPEGGYILNHQLRGILPERLVCGIECFNSKLYRGSPIMSEDYGVCFVPVQDKELPVRTVDRLAGDLVEVFENAATQRKAGWVNVWCPRGTEQGERTFVECVLSEPFLSMFDTTLQPFAPPLSVNLWSPNADLVTDLLRRIDVHNPVENDEDHDDEEWDDREWEYEPDEGM